MPTRHEKWNSLAWGFWDRHAACVAGAIILWMLSSLPLFARDLRFDFGPGNLPAAEGFTRVSNREVYDAKRGYGWGKEWGTCFEREGQKDAVAASGIAAQNHEEAETFRVDLSNGVYKATVWIGDPSPGEGRMGLCVAINGNAVVPSPGVGGWGSVIRRSLPAIVTNSRLDVMFFVSDKGPCNRLSVLGMEIVSVTAQDEAANIRHQWDDAPSMADSHKRTIVVGGKELTEVGRRKELPLPTLTDEWKNRALLSFTRRNPGDLLDYSIPKLSELTASLAAFAVPNDDQPFFLALYATRGVEDVRIGCSDLIGADGRIPRDCVEIFTMTCQPKSPTIGKPGSVARIASDLLERNIPFALTAGKTQPIFVRVRVPEEQQPGLYTGTLGIDPSGEDPLAITIKLRVLPIKLKRPEKKVWHLYSDSGRWRQMSSEAMRCEILDIYRHGINSMKLGHVPLDGAFIEENGRPVDADYGRIGEGMRYAARLGMNGPLIMGPTPSIVARFQGWSINQKGKAEKRFMDGPNGRMLYLRHASKDDRSELGARVASGMLPGESVRLDVRYRLSGSSSAAARLSFMKSYKRDPVETGKISLPLPDTGGKSRIVYGVSRVPEDAIYACAGLQFNGGPGELVVEEIRLLGADGLLNHLPNGRFGRDFDPMDLNKPWSEPFMRDYVQAIKAHGKAAEHMGFVPFIEGTDEAGENPKKEVKEVNELKGARLSGYKTWCNLAPSFVEKVGQYLDGVCFYASLLGNEEECRKLVELQHQAGRQMYFISSGTYGGQDYDMMPNRYGVGFFFWKNGCDGTGIWTFQRPIMDPFNDFDGWYKDCCLVYPPREKGGDPIPTIAWEGIREGWKDFCYVNTLAESVKQAQQEGRKDAVEKGQLALGFVQSAIPWYDQYSPQQFDNQTADNLRWLAAWATMEVQNKTATKPPRPSKDNPPKIEAGFQAGEVQPPESPSICPVTAKPPALDGRLDDAEWKTAGRMGPFEKYQNPGIPATHQTEVLYCHDQENLYIGIRCHEPTMAKLVSKERETDGDVFADDSLEIFIDSDNDEFTFYQLCFNADGSRFDMECAGAYNYGESIFAVSYDKKKVRNKEWNGAWKVVTSRQADRWEAEVVLPFKTVGRNSDLWGWSVGRNRRTAEAETSSLKGIGFFHQPERFNKLLLAGARIGPAVLNAWKMDPTWAGQATLYMELGGIDQATGRATVTEDDDKPGRDSEKEILAGGKLMISYNLQMGDQRLAVAVDDPANQALYRFNQPIRVPDPLQIVSPRQIFFPGDASGEYQLFLPVAQSIRKTSRLKCAIEREKAVLQNVLFPVESERAVARFDLNGQAEGFYDLVFRLIEEGKKTPFAEKRLPVVIVPHFLEPAAKEKQAR